MESFAEQSLYDFSEALAGKVPVPGGGGAAAYAGALAAALGSMVGAFTVDKKTYADVREDIEACMVCMEEIRKRLLVLVDEDAKNFEPLSKAYAIPKDDPERDAILEECLKKAIEAPYEILHLCGEVVLLQKEFATKGSKLMISDAACGAVLARAAVDAAAVNIKVNTRLLRDRAYAEELDTRIDIRRAQCEQMADEIFAFVMEQLSTR